jgi:subtilisin family serine protease
MNGGLRIFAFLFLLGSGFGICAQHVQGQGREYAKHGWQLLDYRDDGLYGAGVTRAYRTLLAGKKSHPVIVAIIDGGLDTAHEDLVGHIWTNKKEIPGNGIDDDHNGYVDDVHGWNFLGGKDGRNIVVESFESYREYYRLTHLPPLSPDSIEDDAAKSYMERVKKGFLKDSLGQAKTVAMVAQIIPRMQFTDSLLRAVLQKDSLYVSDIKKLRSPDSLVSEARKNGLQYFRKYGIAFDMPLGKFILEAEKYLDGARQELNSFSVDPNAQRRDIVQDDFNNINDRNYGNNNIAAGNASHATHVAGIIAASRNNGKGMDGIADNVLIMPVRAVPEGDERDKDIALAIRYAVDNGARIINMSFGKYFSPGEKWVDDAIEYAAAHDVLLVHNAGNEGLNIDSVTNYPHPEADKRNKRVSGSSVFITVGASNSGPDSLIVARFSNYGQSAVDLFAPGVKIYSTVPGNQYEAYSGTSMSAPIVTGIAALLLEYFPRLSARQLKYIIVHSAMKLPRSSVKLSKDRTVDFRTLSAGGGLANACNAVKLAAAIKGERRKAFRMNTMHPKDFAGY